MSFFPEDLFSILQKRIQDGSAESSYTKRLVDAGPPLILRKLVEEAGEVVGASIENDKEHLVEEMADLWYHALVVLAYHGVSPEEVQKCLKDRHGK